MFDKKEDTYKGYSESNPQPLSDDGYAPKAADSGQDAPFAPPQPNTYGQPQQPYASVQPNAYGQSQPYAPVQPNAYGQPQQPYAPVQPNAYGQPQPSMYGQPPFAPGPVPKKKSVGKTIAIVLACVVGVNVAVFFIGVLFGILQSPDKKVEAYNQSGNLADMIDACDIYDNKSFDIDDKIAAEQHFETALSDTKAFLRAFPNAECVDYYNDDNSAYAILMADWFGLMLLNGQYDKFEDIFVKKMLECAPNGNYYLTTGALQDYIQTEIFTPTEEQKQVILSAFDALIEASRDETERLLNLQEYYDFCEALHEYDKADSIEQQINALQNNPASAA